MVDDMLLTIYQSPETVLTMGEVAQLFPAISYKTIFAVSYLTRAVTIDQTKRQFRKMKDAVLTNLIGIEP
jgi:hypothetical protein